MNRLFLAIAFLFATVTGSMSQVTASLQGTVTDPTGAVVAGAKISATDTETNTTQTTATNMEGAFVFTNLRPGRYSLRVELPGFKTYEQVVSVEVGASASVPIVLKIGGGETVPVSAEAETKPVYNAIFKPTADKTKDQLYDGRQTTVRFFIGLPDLRNGLSRRNWAVNPKILTVQDNLPLSVIMNCVPCASDSVQTRLITYSGKEQKSSEAVFKFVPFRNRANKDGIGEIIFSIQSQGVEIDRIVAKVTIGERSQQEIGVGNGVHTFEPSRPAVQGADLIIVLSSDLGGTLSIQLNAINPELISKFKGRQLDGVKLRSFPISLNAQDLQFRAYNAYVQLRGIVDQYDQPLQAALAGAPNGGVKLPPSTVLQFKQQDYDRVLGLLDDIGTSLYRRLFVDDVDDNLRQMMIDFKNFSLPNRPVKVGIAAKDVHFPWQLLHPPGNTDEGLFWGIRYVLFSGSLRTELEGGLPGPIDLDDTSDQLFAGYQADTNKSEEVSQLASEQLAHFKEKLGGNVHLAQSSGEFVDLLKSSGDSVRTIFAYMHGTSGIEFQPQASGAITVEMDIRGPRLLFGTNNFVTPITLESLLNDLDENHQTLFGESPLVFLNACETGASGMLPLTGPSFPDALLHLGARGVIATESPVWAFFAYHFGNDLIDELSTGTPVPEALFNTQHKYLQAHNPLGLLYSYYGAPDARIVISHTERGY